MTDYGQSSDAIAALSAVPFRVTQRNGTEAPFENELWDHKEPGLHVDVVRGNRSSRRSINLTARVGGPVLQSRPIPKTWRSAMTAPMGWHLILDTKRQEAVDQGLAHSHRPTYDS